MFSFSNHFWDCDSWNAKQWQKKDTYRNADRLIRHGSDDKLVILVLDTYWFWVPELLPHAHFNLNPHSIHYFSKPGMSVQMWTNKEEEKYGWKWLHFTSFMVILISSSFVWFCFSSRRRIYKFMIMFALLTFLPFSNRSFCLHNFSTRSWSKRWTTMYNVCVHRIVSFFASSSSSSSFSITVSFT